MATNAMKPKSGRKALTDLTNNENKNKRSSSKSKPSICGTLIGKTKKKQQVEVEEEKCRVEQLVQESEYDDDEDDGDVLDSLLLVQSDLTCLLHQIDDLVVQALKLNDTGKKGRKEIKSFVHALTEVSSSLKPWTSRLQNDLLSSNVESGNCSGKTLSIGSINPVREADDDDNDVCGSPEQTHSDLLISPSPLVSWRANCTINRSRQLFLLTPLPISKTSSKGQCPSRFASQIISNVPKIQPLSEVDTFGDKNDYMFDGVARNLTLTKHPGAALVERECYRESGCTSPEFAKRSIPNVNNTSIKTSPPKSCILLEPVSKSSHQTVDKVYKSTSFPVRQLSLLETSHSALVEMGSSKESRFTSPESSKRNLSTVVVTPFKISPPNTCNLLQPVPNSLHQPVEKLRKSTPYPIGKQKIFDPDTPEFSGSESSALISKYPELGEIQSGPKLIAETKYETSPDWFLSLSPPKTCVLMEPPDNKSLHNQNVFGGCSVLTNVTPMRKEPESMIRTGRRPGENTLKKELWAKFETASTGECFKASAYQKKQKGFLDLLEEASGDETELDSKEGQR